MKYHEIMLKCWTCNGQYNEIQHYSSLLNAYSIHPFIPSTILPLRCPSGYSHNNMLDGEVTWLSRFACIIASSYHRWWIIVQKVSWNGGIASSVYPLVSVCSCNRFGISTFLWKFFTTTSSRLVSPCAARSPFPESVDVSVVDGNISYTLLRCCGSVFATRCCIGWLPGQCSDRSLGATTNFEFSRACWVLVDFGRLLLLMNLVELHHSTCRIMLNNSSGACVSCDKLYCD